jgi:hypothetical protein
MRPPLSGLSSTGDKSPCRLGAGIEGNKVCLTKYSQTLRVLIVDNRWLYTLFLALDANFRMSRKGVSTKDRDPCLTQGRGYFVEDDGFLAHLEAHKGYRQEVSDIFQSQSIKS